MTSRTIVVLLVGAHLAQPAAARDLASRLQGKWLLDRAASFEIWTPPAYQGATPEKQKEMRESLPEMIIEFTADRISMKVGKKADRATYKVTRADQTSVWFEAIKQESSGKQVVDKLHAEFLDTDTMRLSKEGDPLTLVLRRQK